MLILVDMDIIVYGSDGEEIFTMLFEATTLPKIGDIFMLKSPLGGDIFKVEVQSTSENTMNVTRVGI